jgi:hypothetical protein
MEKKESMGETFLKAPYNREHGLAKGGKSAQARKYPDLKLYGKGEKSIEKKLSDLQVLSVSQQASNENKLK